MEKPVQTAARLLSSLEEFADQETGLLRSKDFAEAGELCQRAAPLIQKLAELAREPEVAALQARVGELLERRGQNRQLRDAELVRLRSELRRIDEARVRLSGLAPAYGSGSAGARSRLNTAA